MYNFPYLSASFLKRSGLKNGYLEYNFAQDFKIWIDNQDPPLYLHNLFDCEKYLRELILLITGFDSGELDKHLKVWGIDLHQTAKQLSSKKQSIIIEKLAQNVIQSWNQQIFPAFSEGWFGEHGAMDPKVSEQKFQTWIKQKGIVLRPYNQKDHEKYIIELCHTATGLSKTAIRQYCAGPKGQKVKRQFKISTIRVLNHLLQQLHYDHIMQQPLQIPDWGETTILTTRGISAKRITIFTEYAPSYLPSLLFHTRMINGILMSGSKHLFTTSIQVVTNTDYERTLAQVIRMNAPDAIILIRPTVLSQKVIESLKRNLVPTILVHAHRIKNYTSPPILANCVPDQKSLSEDLKKWIKDYHDFKDLKKIIVVSVTKEQVRGSIRDDRIEKIYHTLNELNISFKHIFVKNYSFESAFEVFEQSPDADLYITLADQISGALKLMLIAKGNYKTKSIMGFDNSTVSQVLNFDSWEQNIELVGEKIGDLLSNFYSKEFIEKKDWPAFKEIKVPINLIDKEGKF
jgi:DNA-binding LacI/PurR family transcriptional regulator